MANIFQNVYPSSKYTKKKKSNSPVESEERVLHVRIIVRIIVLAQSLTRMSLRVIRPVRLVPQCKY